MSRDYRVTFCGLIGMLLFEDQVFREAERRFLDRLMSELELDLEARKAVYTYARAPSTARADIERLRRDGLADVLIEKLREAALADGEVQAEESALIDSVEEVIRLRLGAERYPVSLEGLNHAPLKELYALESAIDEGNFGLVLKGRERSTGRWVVIKRLRAEVQKANAKKRAKAEDRFWREVAILGTLSSPYSVRLLGAGFDTDVPYMVLEYIEGRTLRATLDAEGAFSQRRARRLVMHMLHAIADAHSKGVIHRDLKPANVVVSGQGSLEVARVLDFGLAGILRGFEKDGHVTVTRVGELVGSPSYMPPEQILELTTPRPQNDVYALGLLLLECLTGRVVVSGGLRQVVKWQASPDEITIPAAIEQTELGAIVARAARKNWQERYPSALEMLADFQSLERRDPVVGARSGVWARMWSAVEKMA